MSFYISPVSLVHLSPAQPDSSVTALVGRPWWRGSVRFDFKKKKTWMHLPGTSLSNKRKKTDDENESNLKAS